VALIAERLFSYFQEDSMRHLTAVAVALALSAFVGATVASAAPGDTYKVKKAECKAKADTMKFGVHLIQKNRWVKDCIAGKHPV
jgi:hypothetical protein